MTPDPRACALEGVASPDYGLDWWTGMIGKLEIEALTALTVLLPESS